LALLFAFFIFPPLAQGQVSLPIEGKGSVAGNSGAFAYSVPIVVPPGRNGLTPQLALTYNSSGGNGFLGVGWNLPIGYVMRSTKNGVDYNCISSTTNPCFVFMLGGASSELIPRTDWCSDCYGAKIESGFIQFRFIGNTHWQAIDKSGTKYLFGQTPASRQDNPDATTQVFKWALDEVTDTHSNSITYAYFKDQGEIYIDKIDYQTNHIVFNRDNSRTDKPTLYGPNFGVTTVYRLSGIDIYSNWSGTTGTLNRKYVLGYCGGGAGCAVSNTGRSLLGKVTQYGSDGAIALPDITFAYQNTEVNWTTPTSTGSSPTPPLSNQCFSGDLNGDGKTDTWCETTSGSGSWDVSLSTGTISSGTIWTRETWNSGPTPAFPVTHQCFTGDLDGDGRTDMWCETGSGSGSWNVWLSTGTSWDHKTTWSNPSPGPSPSFPIWNQCLTGDLDGDGKTDMWCKATSEGGSWEVRLSTGTGWSAPTPWTGPAATLPISNKCLMGDLNGDGKSDFWCLTDNSTGSWQVALSTGTAWLTPLPSWTGSRPGFPVEDRCFTGELNGDGKTDFWCQTGDSTGLWDVRLSTGNGWAAPPAWSGPAVALPVGNLCRTGDLDGDGKTDMWCQSAMGSGSWNVRLSTGSGWLVPTASPLIGISVPNPWRTGPSLNTPRQRLGVGVANGTLYAIGGATGGGQSFNTVEAYNPITDTGWANKAPMPTPRDALGVGVINGMIYAVGGVDDTGFLGKLEAYNPGTNSWTSLLPAMPTPRKDLAVGVVNGILYAVGGRDSNGPLNKVEAYNPATNNWTSKAPMPTARYRLAVAVVNGILYAIGGDDGNLLSTVEAYNPATDTWTPNLVPMPPPIVDVPSGAGVVNGILYVISTGTGDLASFDTLKAYDPITNTWTDNVPMPTNRYGLAAGVVNETLYMVGGFTNAAGVVGTVQAYTPTDMNPCREGDLNGDGKIDFWCYQSSGNWKVAMMNNGISDLLIGLSNGIGGNTAISYKPSSADWSSTDSGWNLPFVTQNVASISICDKYSGTSCVAGANISTTDYNYAGAYYNAPDRKFRGYSYVKATNAANNNTTETWFHQGNGTSAAADNGGDSPGYTAGRPYRTVLKEGGSVVRSQKDILYAADADGAAPYFTPIQQEDNWFCDAPSTCKQTRSILTFDHTNGNLTREDQYGDLSVATDDRTVTKSYSPNSTAWILGFPTRENIYQGIGTTTLVAKTDFYYDAVSDCNTPSTNQTPTKGDLTRIVRWLSGETSPESRMAYDTYGNLICTRDANGNTTTLSYDASSTFPKNHHQRFGPSDDDPILWRGRGCGRHRPLRRGEECDRPERSGYNHHL
jgi:YD repeat-containing protein